MANTHKKDKAKRSGLNLVAPKAILQVPVGNGKYESKPIASTTREELQDGTHALSIVISKKEQELEYLRTIHKYCMIEEDVRNRTNFYSDTPIEETVENEAVETED